MLRFVGERPYICPSCPKCFARPSALRIHKMSVHEETKSFLCPECGSAFKANSALIDHRKRVHLHIKQHQCEYCKKNFFSKKDHSEHIRTHTGEKPYQCQVRVSFSLSYGHLQIKSVAALEGDQGDRSIPLKSWNL